MTKVYVSKTAPETLRYDLHIHSKYSFDGILEPKEIISIAAERGLDGVAVTDHNTIKGGLEAKKYETRDFTVIVGCEVRTQIGEVLGLFIAEEIEQRNFEAVVAEIRKQGGITVLPHPFDRFRSPHSTITSDYLHLIDAVETFNARCVLDRFNAKASKLALSHDKPVVGGSDAHYPYEIGLGQTITKDGNVRKAILEGSTSVVGIKSSLASHIRTGFLKFRRMF